MSVGVGVGAALARHMRSGSNIDRLVQEAFGKAAYTS